MLCENILPKYKIKENICEISKAYLGKPELRQIILTGSSVYQNSWHSKMSGDPTNSILLGNCFTINSQVYHLMYYYHSKILVNPIIFSFRSYKEFTATIA